MQDCIQGVWVALNKKIITGTFFGKILRMSETKYFVFVENGSIFCVKIKISKPEQKRFEKALKMLNLSLLGRLEYPSLMHLLNLHNLKLP